MDDNEVKGPGVSYLSGLGVRGLDMKMCKVTTLEHLHLPSRLRVLNFSYMMFNDPILTFEVLAQLLELEHLLVAQTNTTNEALSRLQPLAKLTALDIDLCKQLTDEAVRILNTFPSLKIVSLFFCDISSNAKLDLLETIKEVKAWKQNLPTDILDAHYVTRL
jgi:hypothetical protein